MSLEPERESKLSNLFWKLPKLLTKDKNKKKIKYKKAEKLQWHAEAIHDNCRGCHRAFNKKYKPKKAPTTCTKCHPKKKKS